MDWMIHRRGLKANDEFLSPLPLPIPFLPPPPPPPPPPPLLEDNLESKISPSILLIIVILAVIFFISGLLHLLVRYLLRPTNREPEEMDSATALQGQLQQLFHLHDSGVDQSYIDTLPVFLYKAIIGLKDPFDCAVCLCEFEADDKLRLLPKCSHAFHLDCIDTWLLSHSTCPLCRSSLIPDYSPNTSLSPVVLVLESGSESSREIGIGGGESARIQDDDFGPSIQDANQKTGEVGAKEDMGSAVMEATTEAKVVQVKLGKFRNVDATSGGEGSGTADSNLDQRRCFSMGSYEYVMDERSSLRVAIKPSKKKPGGGKKPGHRLAMSECDCHSKREGFKGFDAAKSSEFRGDGGNARISSKRESFSVSKTWLRPKREKSAAAAAAAAAGDSSRRAFSFRLPLPRASVDHESKNKASVSPTTVSEYDAEMDLDVEVGSCNNSIVSMGSQLGEAPSFARRTLLWIVGRQNRVGSHL